MVDLSLLEFLTYMCLLVLTYYYLLIKWGVKSDYFASVSSLINLPQQFFSLNICGFK